MFNNLKNKFSHLLKESLKMFFTLLSPVLFSSCNVKQNNEYLAINEGSSFSEIEITQEHPGKKLMEDNCYLCHRQKAAQERMVAPPMAAVKMYYLTERTSKEEFTNEIVSFVKNPSEETAQMPGAVKEFGLMPYQFYPENTLRQIADYMFEHEIEEPE